jgi:hypothetical protein
VLTLVTADVYIHIYCKHWCAIQQHCSNSTKIAVHGADPNTFINCTPIALLSTTVHLRQQLLLAAPLKTLKLSDIIVTLHVHFFHINYIEGGAFLKPTKVLY